MKGPPKNFFFGGGGGGLAQHHPPYLTVWNKNKQNITKQNIHVSNKPARGNAKIQRVIAKHVFDCFEKRKRKTARSKYSRT